MHIFTVTTMVLSFNKYKTLLTALFILLFIDVQAQENRSKIVSRYVFVLCNNIEWPNKPIDKFNIKLLSDNKETIKAFKDLSNKNTIQGKAIDLSIISTPDDIDEVQVIFIAEDKHAFYKNVFDRVAGKETLIISDNYKNKEIVMLNLYETDQNTISFEINKHNIINQKLKYSDDLLLMGGSEIDAAKIYFKAQQNLKEMEHRIQIFEKELDSLSSIIESRNELVDELTQSIASQEIIQQQQKEKIHNDSQFIKRQSYKINHLNNDFKNTKTELDKYRKEIFNSNQVLENKSQQIAHINKEIEDKNLLLKDMDTIISKQKQIVKLYKVMIAMAFIMALFILYAYSQKRKKNKELNAQKEIVDKMNTELISNNEELQSTLEEVKRMQDELVQSEKMASIGVLTAGIAHEINNPINFVYAGINTLLRDFEDIDPIIKEVNRLNPDHPDIQQKIRHIKELKKKYEFDEAFEAIPDIINDIRIGADRTAEIVKGLKSFSQTNKTKTTNVNVHESIDTALLLLKNKYKERITIVKNYDKKLPLIEGFEGKLSQVFLNIISNAIDAIDKHGEINIQSYQKSKHIYISIKDNGCGMDTKVVDKIFDPFYSTKQVGEGTGLGLSISYGIIQDHQGEIIVNSALREGTEFIIKLPFSNPERN